MNSCGCTMPRPGRYHRISASTPTATPGGQLARSAGSAGRARRCPARSAGRPRPAAARAARRASARSNTTTASCRSGLRAVHREVGVAQQHVGGAVVDVRHRDADAHPDAHLAVAERERCLQRLGDPLGDLAARAGPACASCTSTANSSPPKRATTSPARTASTQPLGDESQQQVTDVMALRVVDRLEAVEVAEQYGDAARCPDRSARSPAAAGTATRLASPVSPSW